MKPQTTLRVLLLLILVAVAGALCTPIGRAGAGDETTIGYTIWKRVDPEPYGWLRIDLYFERPGLAEDVAHHERDHRHVMALHGLCLRWLIAAAAGGSDYRLAMEASAFCAEAESRHARGAAPSLDAAIRILAPYLTSYGFGLTEAQAESQIRYYCQLPENQRYAWVK